MRSSIASWCTQRCSGAKAFEIWTDIVPAVDAMRKALQDAVYK